MEKLTDAEMELLTKIIRVGHFFEEKEGIPQEEVYRACIGSPITTKEFFKAIISNLKRKGYIFEKKKGWIKTF